MLRGVAHPAELAPSNDLVEQLEAARLAEQARLDALKGPGARNRLGQFATPPRLSLELARLARSLWRTRSERVRFLDPAVGTGSFYGALRQAFPAREIETAAGVEMDPAFARAARRIWAKTGLRVTGADFTRLAPPPPGRQFNLIMSNPPYVRHHHLPAADKRRLQAAALEQLGLRVSGLAGLYCHFLFLCHRWMDDGALAVWLVPSEFMEVNYGAAVRRYLAERVTLRRIHRFNPADVQFADALVTSAVVVFEKRPPQPGGRAAFSHGGTLAQPDVTEDIALADLRGADKWTLRPRRTARHKVTGSHTLGDLFQINRGLATGANSFFIMSRSDAAAHGIPDIAMKPVLPGPKTLEGTVIEADADGWPAIPQPLALVDCTLPEEAIRERYPRFWAHLQAGMRDGVHNGYLASRRRPWYSQEQREPAPFLCTYMGRQGTSGRPFRFVWNKSRALAANVYLMMYPRPALAQALGRDPALAEDVFRALNELENERLIAEARVYGGGLHKLEPSELAALPVRRFPRCTPSCAIQEEAPS